MQRVYDKSNVSSTRHVSDSNQDRRYEWPMADYESLLSTIVEERRSREWTQADLAREVGVGQSAVGNWEAGRNQLRVRTMLELGAVFGMTLEWMPVDRKRHGQLSTVLSSLSRLGDGELDHVLSIIAAVPDLDPDVLEALSIMARGRATADKRTA